MGDDSLVFTPVCRLLLVLLLSAILEPVNCLFKPNIIVLLADDAGYNDFQNHDPSMVTPNIESLRQEGLFLNQSYAYPSCVPSRTALLSGRYAHVLGTQDDVISSKNKAWLDENLTLLPGELKQLGYYTHMLGKWHLGFCHPGLTPPLRGFDSFYGFWLGAHGPESGYYTHTKGSTYDFHDGNDTDWSASGQYQTSLLNDRAVNIISSSSPHAPFFMYMSWGAVHGPFDEPPQVYMDQCLHITDSARKIHCAMMVALDEGVGRIVQALKDKGVYDNTVILFMSDNGGPVPDYGSNNWPLRGGKKGLFEGGIRVYTVFRAPNLWETNTVWSGLAHSVDWLPTLVKIAGGDNPAGSHGKNLWWALKRFEPSPRDFLLYADDFPQYNYSSLRLNEFKLIGPVPGLDPSSRWKVGLHPLRYPPYQMIENGSASVVDDFANKYHTDEYLLFNIHNDPEELYNLADDPAHADVLSDMQSKLLGKLNQYPLTHTRTDEEIEQGDSEWKQDGEIATCWCNPPGLTDLDYLCSA